MSHSAANCFICYLNSDTDILFISTDETITFWDNKVQIKVRGNQEWTLQRIWQHWIHKTNKTTSTTQYVLDTTMHKTQDEK